MTEQNKITITQRDDGVYEARDGCHKWVSKNGIDWLQQDGKPPPLRALRSAMFRHWEGGQRKCCGLGACVDDKPAPDPLTDNERTALEGAIEDAKAGLNTSIYPVTKDWYERNLPSEHRPLHGGRVYGSRVYWELSFTEYDIATAWSVETGERTVLNREAVAEVEGYKGLVRNWPRGRAYQNQDGCVIVLGPEPESLDYFIGPNIGTRPLCMQSLPKTPYYPIPGSTGRLVPEIITNETNETE